MSGLQGRLSNSFARIYFWLAERLYHELAWIYDPVSWLVSFGHWDSWRKLSLEYVSGKRILEIGFGTGELLLEMSRRGYSAFGLDASPQMQRITTRKLLSARLDCGRVHAVSQQIPFACGSFDTIIATFPAQYILDPLTFHEAARLLRPCVTSDGAQPARLVILGAFIGSNRRPFPPVSSRSSQQALDYVISQLSMLSRQAGLSPQIIHLQQKGFDIPIFIAHK